MRYFVEVVLQHKPEATLEEVIAWCAPRVHRLCPLDTPERTALLRQEVVWQYEAVRADPSPGLMAQAVDLLLPHYPEWSLFDVLALMESLQRQGVADVR